MQAAFAAATADFSDDSDFELAAALPALPLTLRRQNAIEPERVSKFIS